MISRSEPRAVAHKDGRAAAHERAHRRGRVPSAPWLCRATRRVGAAQAFGDASAGAGAGAGAGATLLSGRECGGEVKGCALGVIARVRLRTCRQQLLAHPRVAPARTHTHPRARHAVRHGRRGAPWPAAACGRGRAAPLGGRVERRAQPGRAPRGVGARVQQHPHRVPVPCAPVPSAAALGAAAATRRGGGGGSEGEEDRGRRPYAGRSCSRTWPAPPRPTRVTATAVARGACARGAGRAGGRAGRRTPKPYLDRPRRRGRRRGRARRHVSRRATRGSQAVWHWSTCPPLTHRLRVSHTGYEPHRYRLRAFITKRAPSP